MQHPWPAAESWRTLDVSFHVPSRRAPRLALWRKSSLQVGSPKRGSGAQWTIIVKFHDSPAFIVGLWGNSRNEGGISPLRRRFHAREALEHCNVGQQPSPRRRRTSCLERFDDGATHPLTIEPPRPPRDAGVAQRRTGWPQAYEPRKALCLNGAGSFYKLRRIADARKARQEGSSNAIPSNVAGMLRA